MSSSVVEMVPVRMMPDSKPCAGTKEWEVSGPSMVTCSSVVCDPPTTSIVDQSVASVVRTNVPPSIVRWSGSKMSTPSFTR